MSVNKVDKTDGSLIPIAGYSAQEKVDAVTDGDMRAVTSNAVHDALYKTSVVVTREAGSSTTLADMLNELFSKIDASKMTEKAMLIYRNPSAQVKAILSLSYHAIDWSEIRFVGFLNSTTNADGILTMFVKSAASTATRCTLDANGVTFIDLGTIMWMDQLELIY